MSKLLFCSKKEDLFKMNNMFEENGFEKSCDYGDIGIISYKKLRINNKNYYFENDDFVVGVGTYVYDSMKDSDALEKIYKDFDSNHINMLQQKILGAYCICIKKNDNIFIFIDSNHIYNMYYYVKDDRIVMTNTYFHIAYCIKKLKIDEVNVISRCYSNPVLSNETPFVDIKKIMGNEKIVINIKNMEKFKVEKISKENICNYSGNLAKNIIYNYKNLSKIFNNFGICLTGGQDSRLAMSVLLSLKIKPHVFYGKGNSILTWTKEEDLKISKNIADKYNLDFKLMDWSDFKVDDEVYNKNLKKYGEIFFIYGCNSNIINEYENKLDVDFIEYGYFGEIYRNLEWLEEIKNEKITLNEFADKFYINHDLRDCVDNSDFIRQKIIDSLKNVCVEKNIDINNISKDDILKIHIEYRKINDTEMCNFTNLFCYSFPLLSSPFITLEIEKLKYNDKIESRFLLKLMKELDKNILNIPFFSHLKKMRYNEKKGILIPEHEILSIWKEKVRSILKNKILLLILRKAYHIMIGDRKGYKELKDSYAEKNIKKETYYNITNMDYVKFVKNNDIRRINSYDQMMYLIMKTR